MGSEMDTFTARLASFDTVLKPERRRSSTTKSSKAVAWPHQKPSPAEVSMLMDTLSLRNSDKILAAVSTRGLLLQAIRVEPR